MSASAAVSVSSASSRGIAGGAAGGVEGGAGAASGFGTAPGAAPAAPCAIAALGTAADTAAAAPASPTCSSRCRRETSRGVLRPSLSLGMTSSREILFFEVLQTAPGPDPPQALPRGPRGHTTYGALKPILRFATLALDPGSRSARLRLAALVRDTRAETWPRWSFRTFSGGGAFRHWPDLLGPSETRIQVSLLT
jgi:hypothetical protein